MCETNAKHDPRSPARKSKLGAQDEFVRRDAGKQCIVLLALAVAAALAVMADPGRKVSNFLGEGGSIVRIVDDAVRIAVDQADRRGRGCALRWTGAPRGWCEIIDLHFYGGYK
jgi:hypothetical protein